MPKSREQKLIGGFWILTGIQKNGNQDSLSVFCAAGGPYGPADLNFTTLGSVNVRCSYALNPIARGDYGIWDLSKRKNLKITFTDSSYYDYAQSHPVYVPITPYTIQWEIAYISKESLIVKEQRGNDAYKFSFTNRH